MDYGKYVTDDTIRFVHDILTDAFEMSDDDIRQEYVKDRNFKGMRYKKWLVIANSGLPFNRDLWHKDNLSITADDKVQIAKSAMAKFVNAVPMWLVVRDNEGGIFGMGRLFNRVEWIEQAVEWTDGDSAPEETRDYFSRLSDEQLIKELSSTYDIVFEKWNDSDKQRELLNVEPE